MKVLLSAYAYKPYAGTEPGNGWNWSRSLIKEGCSVIVFTREGNRNSIETWIKEEPVKDIDFYFIKLPPFLGKYFKETTFINYILWQIFAYLGARKIKLPIDVIHHVTYGSIHGGSLLWLLRKPFIFGPSGGGQTAPLFTKKYFAKNWLKERMRSISTSLMKYSLFHRLMVRNTAIFIATNQDTMNLSKDLGAPRVVKMLDTAIDETIINPRIREFSSEKLKILWVGRILPRKGLILSLEALSMVKIPFTLTIIGDGVDAKLLPGWLRQLNLEEKVNYLGRLEWKEVMNAYQEHDVFLFTSMRDSSPAQLLESLSQGLPVITLDIHGSKEIISEKVGFKAAIGENENVALNIAGTIEKYYRLSQEEKLLMSNEAIKYSYENTWQIRGVQMIKFYKEISK